MEEIEKDTLINQENPDETEINPSENDDTEINPSANIEECDEKNNEIIDEKKSPEVFQSETSSESVNIEFKDANTTNCLALTIQEDHKIIAVKNVFLRSIRMSWKVIVSAITLTILKLFS